MHLLSRVRPRTRTGGECSMACASSPSRRRGCTVPAHVRVTGQTGQCAAGTGTCTAVGKEGTRGRPRRYRLLPTRPARQASTPYLRVRLLFATPGGIDRTSSAGSHATVHGTQNRERRRRKPPRQGAARGDPPAARPVCARFPVSTLVPRFWNLNFNNSSFWGASCYQASGSYPLKPD